MTYRAPQRRHLFDIRGFGAVGDGRTLNTAAFERAVAAVSAAGDGLVRQRAEMRRELRVWAPLVGGRGRFLADDSCDVRAARSFSCRRASG